MDLLQFLLFSLLVLLWLFLIRNGPFCWEPVATFRLLRLFLAPSMATMIPSAVLLGVGGGVLWSAQGTYLTTAALGYSFDKNLAKKSSFGLFSSIFFTIFSMNQIVGGLISSLVPPSRNDAGNYDLNKLIYIFLSLGAVALVILSFLRKEEYLGPKKEMTQLQNIFRTIYLFSGQTFDMPFTNFLICRD